MADGSIIIDTILDNKGIDDGVERIKASLDKSKTSFSKAEEASKKLAKSVALTGAAATAVITGLTIHGGFARAMAVEEAQSKLRGLGHSAENITEIMNNALGSVRGTAFGLGDAASLAAQLVAAGIEPGQELEKTLKTVADTAAISGREMSEIGMVFSKAAAKGKLQGGELLSLMESGIPVLQMLGTNTKVTEKAMAEFGDSSTESIQKLVSEGKISFEEFEESMRTNMGGAALEMGDTFKGSISNMKAALGRIGAELVTPFMDWVVTISKDLIPAIDSLGGKIKETVPKIIDFFENSELVTPVLYTVAGAITAAVIPGLIGMATASVAAIAPLLPFIVAGSALAAVFYKIQNTSGLAKGALIALGIIVGTFTGIMIALTVASKKATLVKAADTAATLVKTTATVASIGVTSAATAAQWLLNAAMSANPISLVIIAIVGLIAILVILWNKNEGFKNALIASWDAIVDALKSIGEWILGIPEWYIGVWKSIFDKSKEWINNLSNYLGNAIPKIIDDLKEWFLKIPYNIGYAVGYALVKVLQWVDDMNKFFTIEIPKMIESINKWFGELPGKIKVWFDKTIANIVKWGTDLYTQANKNVSEFIQACEKWIAELPGRFKTWLNKTIESVVKWGTDLYIEGEKNIREFIQGIEKTLSELPGKFVQIGSDCIKGIVQGFNNAKQWLQDQIGSFMGGIVSGAKAALGIHSPSRIFRDQVGTNIVKGIGVGVDIETPNLEKDIDANMSDLVAKMSATVDYETAMTTARVITRNDILSGGTEDNNDTSKDNLITVVAKLIVDSKEFTQTVVAPNQDILTDYYEGR